ncbi:hypothetical protein [Frigidibacter mobilis]|uniref:Uncharacterized protein n=1 Tax=Frigidibacter mobilis TaxID=1335048 RepID=A0A159Z2W4_9RHOB|nr:hypothetical protein [Frigidibacter mobilis]AMY68450.1 hypothetical protein AKL17_1194 [Frigidibacter mobilis]
MRRISNFAFRRVGLLVLLPALVLGTALSAGSWPVRADRIGLTSQKLTVWFADGSVCRAAIQSEGGQGMFTDCPHPARFDVRIKRQNFLAPVLGDLVAPLGTVTVISADGRAQKFLTPASRMPGWKRD